MRKRVETRRERGEKERGDIFAQHTFRDIVLQPRWPLCDQPFRGSFNREREGFGISFNIF